MSPLDPSLVRFRAVDGGRARRTGGAPPGDQRPQRLPGRRRRHGRQHGPDAARRARRARAPGGAGARSTRSAATRSSSRSPARRCWARAATSGVILSQLVRGAAEELISRPGELVDPVLVAASMARASDRAYASVREPAEGTILTVAREMAARMASELAHMPDEERRLGPVGDADLQNRLLAKILMRALETGEASLKRGPELLPILRQAGVVDAGAYGLLVVLSGVVGALQGEAQPALEHHAPARVTHPQHESSTYRYCTNFAVTGDDLASSYFIPLLEQIGDSVLVVGDRATLKVHVHTDDPERATAIFAEHGSISHLDVADMREQVLERAERLGHATADVCGVLAVVSGDGMAELFRSLGATPLDGGPTLNPSTYELLAGIHTVAAEEVVVLPNSAQRPHGGRARRRAVGQGRPRRAVALPAGGPRRRRRAGRAARRGGQRARDAGRARQRPHRRRHRGRPRRRRAALPRRRGDRLHRRADRRLGRAGGHAPSRARRARGGRGAADADRGPRRAPGSRPDRGADPGGRRVRGVRTAGSRATGGCSRPSRASRRPSAARRGSGRR